MKRPRDMCERRRCAAAKRELKNLLVAVKRCEWQLRNTGLTEDQQAIIRQLQMDRFTADKFAFGELEEEQK